MNALNTGPMGLEIRTDSGQPSLKAGHACRKAPINLIDATLLAITNRTKALACLAFSAAS